MDVLVDLDGTLIDPKPGLIGSVQYALDRLGFAVPPADELVWLIGPPFRVSFPKLLGSPELTELAIATPSRTPTRGRSWSASISHAASPAFLAPSSMAPTITRATSSPTSWREKVWYPKGR